MTNTLNKITIEEKIEFMLQYYRGKLEQANIPPIDYISGMQISAQIGVLETLKYYIEEGE